MYSVSKILAFPINIGFLYVQNLNPKNKCCIRPQQETEIKWAFFEVLKSVISQINLFGSPIFYNLSIIFV